MGKGRRKRSTAVTATCGICGTTRQVRQRLVEGFDALACAGHHATAADLHLDIPAGHLVSVSLGVAGYFHGFTIAPATPADQRSAHRAASILAAAQGRPAPAADFDRSDTEWIDRHLLDALTAALGTEGWEIADWDCEGDDYVVKVYTDWGWAGFITGTPTEIAKALADERASIAGALETLRCPTCRQRLNPFAGRSQCPCGTVAWRPRAWTSPVDAVRDALTYLDDAPDTDRALDIVLTTICMTSDFEGWAFGSDGGFDDVAAALRRLVPAATWTTVNNRLVGVIPTGARFVVGDAGAVLNAADQLGYRLTTATERWQGMARVTAKLVIDSPCEDMPSWFACTPARDGRWWLSIGAAGWSPDLNNDGAGADRWCDVEDVEEWWWSQSAASQGAWTVDLTHQWPPGGEYCIEASAVMPAPISDLPIDDLRAYLREAMGVIRRIKSGLDERLAEIVAERSGTGQ